MKSIVLAEKPSVAKDYANVLECKKKGNGFFEGDKYIITWAFGHLVSLTDPDYYDRKYKEWNLEDLPIIPEKMRLKVIRQSASQFSIIRKLFERKDVNELIIATDAGREGELVARWIILLAGWKGKLKRLWISSQTHLAIKEGFRNLKNAGDYFRLFLAAVGRSEADWLIGLNVTRALTCKFDAQLSAGRVQTPTLSIIIKREEEIKVFKPVDYWEIEVDFGKYKGKWRDRSGNAKIFETRKVEDIINKIKNKTGIILNIHKDIKKEPPPSAYNLTDLQRDANTKLGFSAKKTLSVLQGLYERHKIATYPRTDSRHITDDMIASIPARLKAIYSEPLKKTIDELLKNKITPKKHFVDNKKVSDHHAIIPTEQKVQYDKLEIDEKKLFNLIRIRFLEVLSESAKIENIVVVTMVNGEKVYSKKQLIIEAGWRKIVSTNPDNLDNSSVNLNSLRKGEKERVINTNLIKLKTSPPARYNEASLLAAMESPGKFITDQKIKESIKNSGLGTPATRADIIEKLIKTDYIIRNGRELIPTEKGFQLMELVPDELKSPELTAKWELKLSEIENGKERKEKFISDIIESTKKMVLAVKKDERKYVAKNLTNIKCPICNKFMLKTNGKKGIILKCSDRKCGHTQDENKKRSDTTPFFKGSKSESRNNKQMINRFSDNKKKASGMSIGSLLEAALSGKKQ